MSKNIKVFKEKSRKYKENMRKSSYIAENGAK